MQSPGAGHNLPAIDLARALEPDELNAWLFSQFAPHAIAVEALLASYSRFLGATAGGITSEEVAGRATDLSRRMRDMTAETDKLRVRIKAPVLAAQRAIDSSAKTIADRLTAPIAEVQRRVTVFLQAKEIEVRRLAMIEASRAEAEATRLMQEASQQGSHEAAQQAVEAIEQQQEAEAIVTAKAADITRVRTPSGGTASLKEHWVYAVTDIRKVPVELLAVDDAMIRAMIKAGSREIAGLEIKNEPKATIR